MSEITIVDVTAYIRRNILCVLCQGAVKVMLTDDADRPLWSNPRVCPQCRGVGQHHTNQIRDKDGLAEIMINYSFK
jgi:hypothetical protein